MQLQEAYENKFHKYSMKGVELRGFIVTHQGKSINVLIKYGYFIILFYFNFKEIFRVFLMKKKNETRVIPPLMVGDTYMLN